MFGIYLAKHMPKKTINYVSVIYWFCNDFTLIKYVKYLDKKCKIFRHLLKKGTNIV
jgi:hypothetical protein